VHDDDGEHVPQFGSSRRFQVAGLNRRALAALGIVLAMFVFIVITGIVITLTNAHRAAQVADAQQTPPAPVLQAPEAVTATDPPLPAPVLDSTPRPATPPPYVPPPAVPLPPRGYGNPALAQVSNCNEQLSPGYVGEISPVCDPSGTYASRRSRVPQQVAQMPSRSEDDDGRKGLQADALQSANFDAKAALASVGGAGSRSASADDDSEEYSVRTGWGIPVLMRQEVDLEFPGPVTAVVREDVYDTVTGKYLLIPKGSWVVGRSGGEAATKDRADVFWTLLRFPSGREVSLTDGSPGGMVAQDRVGANGIDARVDEHRGNILRTSFVATAIAAAAAALTNRNNTVLIASGPSPGTVIAQGVENTANQLNGLDANKPPSIRVGAGKPFQIFVDHDITLPPYDGKFVAGL
jgi:type IV secretory pathway VirB10-like protein